ncbi:tRNA-specific 2-thiouridylase MnmA [Buchnera aphidicola (Cinara kochiana kochiana)]|uniref:tRNA-specific 2-thiouridylase MnmA n=1 Tax=Buchnera aphidicola (Cinara kochiana kochiana) TaxID=2518976 RepID=A0A451D5M1_9GAMM|nr:tRNA 2-thiouridine(34) synthase MnmA [Buchnera aphidicola]VFP81087.1 tRNA-specific 2-thiouridylase MnmA [Buchnera aphidicola (Cinara kochiana kochiana)]
MKKKKVILAMSGGVDSSVSAWLLLKKRYHVEGLFMKNWDEDDSKNYCSAKIDFNDAKLVCKQLGILLHTINFSTEYWEKVFKNFIIEYKQGRTPNPDILCNKIIKFNICLNFALQYLQANYFATGHYAKIKKKKNKYYLYRSIDLNKDQSYFLYTLKSKILSKIIFPLANITKTQTRKIAKKIKLCVYKKKDSTGICFVQPKKFNLFLNQYIPYKVGKILTMSGELLGLHYGYEYYTIGQRKGLKIGGKKNKNMYPWYVVKKNIKLNIILVVQGSKNPYLLSYGFLIKKIHWINGILNILKFKCLVQIRHQHKPIMCCIIFKNKFDYIQVLFNKPVECVTPGQSAVFYQHDQCIGGSIIYKNIPYLP